MSTVIKYITSGGLYILVGVWSFFQVLEYKYYTRVEQYDTIVENMKICKQKYGELLLKMRQLEDRVDELEDILLEHNLEGGEEDLGEEDLEEEETLSLDAEALKKVELNEVANEIVEELNEVKELANEIVEEELSEVKALSAATNEIVVEELSEVANEIVEELNEVKALSEVTNEIVEELNEVKELSEVTNEIVVDEELSAAIVEEEEDEMVDISEETYPIKNQAQNKKGWLKTILFM